ncbi:MAG: alpha/beta hydrolase [Thiohalocapsa sp.]|nr:alpha/beta hydrolase [Thiohalocapsa sp.]
MPDAPPRPIAARVLALLGHIALGLLLAAAAAWLLQPKLVFYPLRELPRTPAAYGFDYRDIRLAAADGVALHGWLVPAPRRRASAPHTLLFLHGNAGNIGHRGDSIALFAGLGLDVLIIDYRGYGKSGGSPSETGLYLDADAAWNWLVDTQGLSPRDIVVFGRSLGGAVAVELAAKADPGALIVESSFDTMRSLARTHFPVLSRVLPLRYRFPAAERIGAVDAPVLVLHSRDDEIVPYALGRRLFAAAPEPKHFAELTGGHNDGFLRTGSDYVDALEQFLTMAADAGASADPRTGTDHAASRH